MKRILRGAVVFAASALVWACNTEPDSVQGGDPVAIVADPKVVLVPQGSVQEVLVRLVDQQGQSLESEISVSAPGTGIGITSDPLFRPVYGADGALTANTANTEVRLEVAGLALGTTTFTVTGSGLSADVTVTVVPSDAAITFSPATPLAGDTVTITLPAGLRFGSHAGITSLRGDNPVFVGVNPDSLSARVILPPNATLTDIVANGVLTIYNPAAGEFSGLALLALPPLPTATLYPTASACAGAPVLPRPSALWDFPPTVATPRHYGFSVPALVPPAVTPSTPITIVRQPSPPTAATGLVLLDAATCAPIPPLPVVTTIPTRTCGTCTNSYTQISAITFSDPLIDGPRTVVFRPDSVRTISSGGDTTMTLTRTFLPPGDYVAQITTGTITLATGLPSDEPVALKFEVK